MIIGGGFPVIADLLQKGGAILLAGMFPGAAQIIECEGMAIGGFDAGELAALVAFEDSGLVAGQPAQAVGGAIATTGNPYVRFASWCPSLRVLVDFGAGGSTTLVEVSGVGFLARFGAFLTFPPRVET